MPVILAILVAALLPSIAVARGGYTPHYSAPAVRAAPTYRSAPMVRTSPAVRTYHAPTVQHVPSGFRAGPIQFSRPLHHVPGVTRVVARRVPWRGLFIAVPAITALGAPVWLDVPDLGAISVDEQIYV